MGQTETFDFVEVVTRFETPLLRYATQVVGPGQGIDPQDVVQEAFLRLHRQIEQNGNGSVHNLQGWLFRVAHNLALDACRKRERESKAKVGATQETASQASEAESALDGLAEMVHKEACERAMAELQNLPEDEKHVILLKIVHGLTLREIGETTGLTIGNVDYRIKRGLKMLSERLKQAGVI